MKLRYPPGATPLDPDELGGLIPKFISTQGELNAVEQANILTGEDWGFGRSAHKCSASHSYASCIGECSTRCGGGRESTARPTRTSVSRGGGYRRRFANFATTQLI